MLTKINNKNIYFLLFVFYVYKELSFRKKIKNKLIKTLNIKDNILLNDKLYDLKKLTKYIKNCSYNEILLTFESFFKGSKNANKINSISYYNAMYYNIYGKNDVSLIEKNEFTVFKDEIQKQIDILKTHNLINDNNTDIICDHMLNYHNNVSFINEPYIIHVLYNNMCKLYKNIMYNIYDFEEYHYKNIIIIKKRKTKISNNSKTLIFPPVTESYITIFSILNKIEDEPIVFLNKSFHDVHNHIFVNDFIQQIIDYIYDHNLYNLNLNLFGWSYGGYIVNHLLNHIKNHKLKIKFNNIDLIEPCIFAHGQTFVHIVPYNSIYDNYLMISNNTLKQNDSLFRRIITKIFAMGTSIIFKHYLIVYKNFISSAYRNSVFSHEDLYKLKNLFTKMNIYISDRCFLTNNDLVYKYTNSHDNKIQLHTNFGYHGYGLFHYRNKLSQ